LVIKKAPPETTIVPPISRGRVDVVDHDKRKGGGGERSCGISTAGVTGKEIIVGGAYKQRMKLKG
jgi:hypothetical protein